MSFIIPFIRLFFPVYGLVVLSFEEGRRHHKHNQFIIILFALLIAKEVIHKLMLDAFGVKIYFTNFIILYYLINFIPVIYINYLLILFISKAQKPPVMFFIYTLLILLSMVFFLITGQPFTFLIQIISRFLMILLMVYIMFRLNTLYLEDEMNIIIKNRLSINTILTILSIQYVFFFVTDNFVKNLIEIVLYGLLAIIIYTRVDEGYDELKNNIQHLGYEKEIFINLLQKVGSGLTSETNFDKILELILNYSVDVIKSKAAALLLVSPDKQYLSAKFVHGLYPPTEKVEGYAATKEKFLVEKFKNEKIAIGRTYLGEVAQKGEAILIEDAHENTNILQTAPDLMDIHSLIVVPLKFKDEVIGVVSFLNKDAGGEFNKYELQLSQTLAEQAAITLNNFRLYNELLVKQRDEREIEIAGDIQKDLLPKQLPQIPGVDLFAYNKSAKGVGGDYYDLLNFDNKRLSVIISDVAGKGVPASLVMVMLRTTLHNILRPHLPPKDILTYLNKFLSTESTQERYATLFYILLDVEKQTITYTNAGQCPLLLYKSQDNTFDLLDTPGLPLGIMRDQKYEQAERGMQKGDIILLYTDGITEAMNTKREQFSIERVKDIIRTNKEKSAQDIVSIIQSKMDEFCTGAPQHDDQTLILLRLV
ncbi:MAG: SpoIIE family protein phosphatase [bacterium]|nr:SpoIIE family protein phosphatase [bacterium]